MYAVILAGGGGTRLWPLSRSDRPKPFLPLLGDRSLLQATVARLSPLIAPEDVYLVTDARYVEMCRDQLPAVPPENIIGEPMARNTAAAVALAAVAIQRPAGDVMAALAADHGIADEAAFREALAAAGRAADHGDLVTLGIRPSGPETGYGYILARESPERAGRAGGEAVRVDRFVEKPTREHALELLATGRASWNASMFIWRRDSILASLQAHAPDILAPIQQAVAAHAALAEAYAGLRATSIDYALMEPAASEGRVSVVPVDMGWSDLGSWAALLELLTAASGTRVIQRAEPGSSVMDTGSEDILVHAGGGRLVVTVGMHDAIVVDTGDAVLVVGRDAAQDVKKIVDRLSTEGRRELL